MFHGIYLLIHLPHLNFEVKFVWLGSNYFQLCWSSSPLDSWASIETFGLDSDGFNSALIVLDSAGSHFKSERSDFGAEPPLHCEFWSRNSLNHMSFNCDEFRYNDFRLYLSALRKSGFCFRHSCVTSTIKVRRLISSPPPYVEFWYANDSLFVLQLYSIMLQSVSTVFVCFQKFWYLFPMLMREFNIQSSSSHPFASTFLWILV